MFIKTEAPHDAMILQLMPMVKQACEILRDEFQRYCDGEAFDIETKSDDSPVTQADFRVNQYITAELSQHFADIPLLSEEGEYAARKDWEIFWLLDPLDGTKEFIHKRPQFTINLSLVEGSTTTFALLAIPGEHTVYFCPKQGLPLKYDMQHDLWSVYAHPAAVDVIQVGLSHSKQKQSKYHDYLAALETQTAYSEYRAGSAYKFCMMLEDVVDLYPRFHPTSEWDTSAGQCLIERIGGGLVDFNGQPFLYNQRESLLNGGFIAYKNEHIKQVAFQALDLMQSMS